MVRLPTGVYNLLLTTALILALRPRILLSRPTVQRKALFEVVKKLILTSMYYPDYYT
jgi:hypothetical protein